MSLLLVILCLGAPGYCETPRIVVFSLGNVSLLAMDSSLKWSLNWWVKSLASRLVWRLAYNRWLITLKTGPNLVTSAESFPPVLSMGAEELVNSFFLSNQAYPIPSWLSQLLWSILYDLNGEWAVKNRPNSKILPNLVTLTKSSNSIRVIARK